MAQAGEGDWMVQTLSLLTTHHLANALLQFSCHPTVPGKHCHIIFLQFNLSILRKNNMHSRLFS